MAEPESEPTATVGAVIEAEISMQWVPRLPPRWDPFRVWACLAPLPSNSREGTHEPQAGLRAGGSFHQKGTRFHCDHPGFRLT